MDTDKTRALDAALRQIERDFGKGSIMRLGEASAKMNIEVIPTGFVFGHCSWCRRYSPWSCYRDLWS